MSKDRQTFIDGIGETRLLDGAIRMDLLAMSPTHKTADGDPTTEFVRQLVMTPVGFVRMVNVMRETLAAMESRGVFTRPEGGASDDIDPGFAETAGLALTGKPQPRRKDGAPTVASGSFNF
jgi:hypothetical protein